MAEIMVSINGRKVPLAQLNEERRRLSSQKMELVEVAPMTFKTRLKD